MEPGWRGTDVERTRIADLVGMLPQQVGSAVDIGARDGFISRQRADRGVSVTALALEKPVIDDTRIPCVKGDATVLARKAQRPFVEARPKWIHALSEKHAQ